MRITETKLGEFHLHKWRYSLVDKPYPKPFEYMKVPNPLVLACYGFVGSRVEGAAISRIEAAESIRKMHS